MKVGIIGMGWVGSSIAISALHAGVAQELWLNDRRLSRIGWLRCGSRGNAIRFRVR